MFGVVRPRARSYTTFFFFGSPPVCAACFICFTNVSTKTYLRVWNKHYYWGQLNPKSKIQTTQDKPQIVVSGRDCFL